MDNAVFFSTLTVIQKAGKDALYGVLIGFRDAITGYIFASTKQYFKDADKASAFAKAKYTLSSRVVKYEDCDTESRDKKDRTEYAIVAAGGAK